jgi:hypothetical protein
MKKISQIIACFASIIQVLTASEVPKETDPSDQTTASKIGDSSSSVPRETSSEPVTVIEVEIPRKVNEKVNKIQAAANDKSMILDVFSEEGIGKATIRLLNGNWTESVVLRFHLGGLEGLSITSGKVAVSDLPSKAFGEDGKPSDKRYLNFGKSYQGKGYYEVKVPKTFLDKATKSFEIQWVDFYRR